MATDLLPSSPRLRFRQMTLDDLTHIHGLLSDPEVMAHYPRPKTRDEAMAWIEWNQANYAADGFGLWLIQDSEGTFLGDCGLTWQTVDGESDLELGYHLLPQHQGRGLATEGALACRDLARRRGITRLIALIRPGNVPSERVARRAGLRLERITQASDGGAVQVFSANDVATKSPGVVTTPPP